MMSLAAGFAAGAVLRSKRPYFSATFGALPPPGYLPTHLRCHLHPRGGWGLTLGPVPCPFLPSSGSGLAGSAADGQAPVVQDLVELRFHNFLSLFCQCGTRHQSCASAASLPKGRLELADCRSHDVFNLLDLACSTKASGRKVRAKVLLLVVLL
jgi:hypothetical protein